MALPNLHQQALLKHIWHRAYTEKVYVIDYTGETNAFVKILHTREAIRSYRRYILRNKFRPGYSDIWDWLSQCSIHSLGKTKLMIVRRPYSTHKQDPKEVEGIDTVLPLPAPTTLPRNYNL